MAHYWAALGTRGCWRSRLWVLLITVLLLVCGQCTTCRSVSEKKAGLIVIVLAGGGGGGDGGGGGERRRRRRHARQTP